MTAANCVRFLCLVGYVSSCLSIKKGAADVHADSQQQQPGFSIAGGASAAAPLLLSLLRELQSEAESGIRISGAMTQWCLDSEAQKSGMINVLRRQLDEHKISLRQIMLEEERLNSEWRLANATAQDKEQQLQDAASEASFASSEFASEQQQIDKTAEATGNAMRLVQARAWERNQEGSSSSSSGSGLDADVSASLVQIPADMMVDSEKSSVSSFMHDGSDGSQHETPSELLETLGNMRTRLEHDKSSAVQEHDAMLAKISAFADHLNSSIMEVRSQVATIRMEAAQRKREHARLDGRVSELDNIVSALDVSQSKTQIACREQEQLRSVIKSFIATESSQVTALLKQVPEGARSSDLMSGVPSMVQVRRTSLRAGGKRRLGRRSKRRAVDDDDSDEDDDDAGSALPTLPSAASDEIPAIDEMIDSDGASNAISDIKQFVAAAGQEANPAAAAAAPHTSTKHAQKEAPAAPIARTSPHATTQKTLAKSANLLNKVKGKEIAITDQQTRCAMIMHDATADTAALARSTQRIDAKLHIVKAATNEYEQGSAYDQEQREAIEKLSRRFSSLVQEDDRHQQRARGALREHAEQLMSVATDLSQQLTVDEQKAAELVSQLAHKVSLHQKSLEDRHGKISEQRKALELADQAVQKLLAEDAEHNRRRLARLKAETQLLSSLALAKQSDQTLSKHYEEVASTVCSGDSAKKLASEANDLQKKEKTLQALVGASSASA